MNELLIFDHSLFILINHLPHNNFLNTIALFFSGVGTAGIVWLFFGAILFFREEKKDHWFAFQLATTVFLIWIFVEQILKPLVSRSRPGSTSSAGGLEAGAIIVSDIFGGFSFPSGHAAIAWAGAILLSQKEPRLRWVFYIIATAISLSRIYLGVHYPSDVLVGALCGWCIANITLRFIRGSTTNKGQLSRSGKGRIR